jgi:hypothetical protein
MMNPARIKKGMARRGNLAIFEKKFAENMSIPRPKCQTKSNAVIPALVRMGTPRKSRKKNKPKSKRPSMLSTPYICK